MRKKLLMLLVIVMACTTIFGCSNTKASNGGSKDAESKESGTGTEKASDSGSDERQTISVMGIDWGIGPVSNSGMEQWWEDYFNVDLDISWIPYADYETKLNTLLATDDLPDVFQVKKSNNSFYYPAFIQAIEAGNIKDLKGYLFDNGFVENNAIMKNWTEDIWQNASYNGGIYILPRSKSDIAPPSGITVREDLVKKYNMTNEPKTMDELKDWLIDLSQKSGLYALDFSIPDFDDNRLKGFAVAYTGMVDWGLNEEGEFTYQAFADGYTDFLKWMKDLYDAKAIDQEFVLNQSDTSKWNAGKSVAYLQAWYNWNQSADLVTNKIFDDSVPDTAEAGCLMPVKGPKGYTVVSDPYNFGEAVAINGKVSDEKLDKIMEVFNCTADDYMSVLLFGVEGIHYTVDANGNRVSDEAQQALKTEGYVGGWNQIFLKTDADMITDKFINKGASEENIARAKELKQTVTQDVEEMDGLKWANLNLYSKSYADYWDTLTSDMDDMRAKFVMGQIDEAQWNKYVDGIVNSDEYKAIQEEYKEAAAAQQQ